MATKSKKPPPEPAPDNETEVRVKIEGSDNAVAIGPQSFAASIKIIFQGSRPIITLLVGIVLIGTILGSGLWWLRQPRRMTGNFNIAVALFSQQGNAEPNVSQIVSQQLFRFLDDQAKLITFENVQVSHKNIGVITSAEEAKTLAQRINAQVVIYGDVTTFGEEARMTPQFYIAEAFRADVGELNGQQKLAAPISFPIGDLLDPTSMPMTLIQERTVIMTEFTKALVYLGLDNLPLAKEAVDQAMRSSESQGPFEGQEVLYLIASQIARLQGDQTSAEIFVNHALELNPQYGRGYIARANIYYDQDNLYQAIKTYKKAKELPNQPFGAYIVEKGSLGIGNSCWVQLQYVKQNPISDVAAIKDLQECARENYQQVIDSFEQQDKPETNIKEMAAQAYYGIATLLKPDQPEEARRLYKRVLELTTDQDLIRRTNQRLQEMKE
jgi:tetratricopeptide (TPR) repeat protein